MPLTTLNQLIDSLTQAYRKANQLILQTAQTNPFSEELTESGTLSSPEPFSVQARPGDPPVEIPLASFQSQRYYYLKKLQMNLPCYTMVHGIAALGGREDPTVLHSFYPMWWQKLFYTCYLYRVQIEVGLDQTKVNFRAATEEEAELSVNRNPVLRWQFQLTPKQLSELALLPKTAARLVYWPLDKKTI